MKPNHFQFTVRAYLEDKAIEPDYKVEFMSHGDTWTNLSFDDAADMYVSKLKAWSAKEEEIVFRLRVTAPDGTTRYYNIKKLVDYDIEELIDA